MKKRKTCAMKFKLKVLDCLAQLSQRAAAERFGVPRRNLRKLKKQEEKLRAFTGSNLTR
ncbi:hypothetical protein PybrP1_005548 [[Pythium] brassicae (nom. inval.)]|nr:hypothetical protein PybrP1_005548 [[Pythium] brassicae (nom. inval.)]